MLRTVRALAHLPLLLALLGGLVSSGAVAQPAVEACGPPEGLDEAVAAVLAPEGLRVAVDGEPVWELWILRELPEDDGAEAAFGQELAALPEGGLVGAVRLLRAWTDYKGTRVDPGLYTLRYLVAPVDGAHVGVSLYRDFLLLVPAGDDGGPGAVYGFEELVDLSRRATGTNHPAVMALFPDGSVAGGEAETATVAGNELDQPTLLVAIGGLRFGVVVEGRGES